MQTLLKTLSASLLVYAVTFSSYFPIVCPLLVSHIMATAKERRQCLIHSFKEVCEIPVMKLQKFR